MTAFIERREFMTLLGGVPAWPLMALGQQPMSVVGFPRQQISRQLAALLLGRIPPKSGHNGRTRNARIEFFA
jgi:hypothetical protein